MTASIDQFKSLLSAKNGIARPNLFRVRLPALPNAGKEELNILCKDVQLPGRQILTSEKRIGMKIEKIPYGYSVNDISMTFHVLNDYGVKEYFEAWQNLAVNQSTYEIGYMRGGDGGGYGKTVTIEQLRKVDKIPSILQRGNYPSRGLQKFLPRLSDINLFDQFYEFGEGLADIIVYKCELENAYPVSVADIQLNNELDGIVELNITLTYTNWKNRQFLSPTNLEQLANNGIRSIIGSIFD